ncbi:MAG TPA: CAP domain-containing protein [Acidimicrobiales bacterium]|nr:CAP domain-containing protein [Acidimicrobiales bacterium]
MLKRFVGPAALAALVVAVGTLVPAAPAAAASAEEIQLFNLVNQVRASVGAPPLELDEGISVVSRAWALQMAAAGDIAHNPNFKTLITGWSRIGENVGMGHPLSAVHQGLVNSPGHYANIVEPAYTRVGIGVVDVGGGNVYVVQNFVRPRTAGASPAAPAAAPPTIPRRAPSSTTAPPRPTPSQPAAAPVTTRPSAAAAPAPSPPAAGRRPATPSPVLVYVLDGLRAFDQRFHS